MKLYRCKPKVLKKFPKGEGFFFSLSLRKQYLFKLRLANAPAGDLGFQGLFRSSLRRKNNFVDFNFQKAIVR